MDRLIETETDLGRLIVFVTKHKRPFTATIRDGRVRSYPQNRLQFMWAAEAASKIDGHTLEDVRSLWKLRIGVPILVAENPDFAAIWALIEERFNYEERLKAMPAIAVTSKMTMDQKKRYLKEVFQWGIEHGIKLTEPEELRSGTKRATSTGRVGWGVPSPKGTSFRKASHRTAPGRKVR